MTNPHWYLQRMVRAARYGAGLAVWGLRVACGSEEQAQARVVVKEAWALYRATQAIARPGFGLGG